VPVSEENEAVLKGKVGKKNGLPKGEVDKNSDDDQPVNAEDI
jgi:hypothetical protein